MDQRRLEPLKKVWRANFSIFDDSIVILWSSVVKTRRIVYRGLLGFEPDRWLPFSFFVSNSKGCARLDFVGFLIEIVGRTIRRECRYTSSFQFVFQVEGGGKEGGVSACQIFFFFLTGGRQCGFPLHILTSSAFSSSWLPSVRSSRGA